MTDFARPELTTLAAGLEDSSDLVAARLVAEHVGSDHRELVYTADDAITLVPEVIANSSSWVKAPTNSSPATRTTAAPRVRRLGD